MKINEGSDKDCKEPTEDMISSHVGYVKEIISSIAGPVRQYLVLPFWVLAFSIPHRFCTKRLADSTRV